jgi:hypothetical protein
MTYSLVQFLGPRKYLLTVQVLLYHFFQDSTVDLAQWRVVLNALEPAQQSKIRAPSFNKRHYAGLCNEVIELDFFR